MRKFNLFLIVLALLCVALFAVSCDGNNPDDTTGETGTSTPTDEKLTVTFDYRDGSDPVVFRLDAGETVPATASVAGSRTRRFRLPPPSARSERMSPTMPHGFRTPHTLCVLTAAAEALWQAP